MTAELVRVMFSPQATELIRERIKELDSEAAALRKIIRIANKLANQRGGPSQPAIVAGQETSNAR